MLGPFMNRKVIAVLVVAVAVVAALWLLPLQQWLLATLDWAERNPGQSWAVFVAIYIITTMCFLPALPLTLAGGAIFGVGLGSVLVSIGSTLGATGAFFIGRTLARRWVAHRIAHWPKFAALDRAVAARGFWVVLLTRLSPAFPYFLLNFAYGITAVRPAAYVLGSWIGMFPVTVAYVYAGSVAANLAQALAGEVTLGRGGWALLALGLAATVAVTWLVTRAARAELARTIGE